MAKCWAVTRYADPAFVILVWADRRSLARLQGVAEFEADTITEIRATRVPLMDDRSFATDRDYIRLGFGALCLRCLEMTTEEMVGTFTDHDDVICDRCVKGAAHGELAGYPEPEPAARG